VGIPEDGFGKGRALVRDIGLIADKRHGAFLVILTQRVAGAGATYAAADDQIVTLDHASMVQYKGWGERFSKKILGNAHSYTELP
jgi:hypothetical protein